MKQTSGGGEPSRATMARFRTGFRHDTGTALPVPGAMVNSLVGQATVFRRLTWPRWFRNIWVRLNDKSVAIPRTTRTIAFSLPPEMAERPDQAMQGHGRSRSEFLREAVLRCIEECQWRQLLQFGEERGVGPEDMAGPVKEYRAEAGRQQT